MRRRSTATSRSRLEKLTVTQLITSSPNFTEPEGSVSHYRLHISHQLSPSWASWTHSTPFHPSLFTVIHHNPHIYPWGSPVSHQNSVRISLLTHTYYLFRPSHPTWSNHHNTARRILKWSSALLSFLQYRVTENSRPTSHRPVVKCPRCQTPSFTPIQNSRQNYGPVHFYLSVLRQQTGQRKILDRMATSSLINQSQACQFLYLASFNDMWTLPHFQRLCWLFLCYDVAQHSADNKNILYTHYTNPP